MKIKLTIAFYLVMCALFAQSQSITDPVMKADFTRAKIYLNEKSRHFAPESAFKIYQQYADKGNAEAMNRLAMLYNQGLGTSVNEKVAFNWFTKAAKAGYSNAWYNLGLMYKNGIATEQNDTKAFESFEKGAALVNPMCFYGKGYMLYKGLGCAQNYEQAFASFKKGATLNDEGSKYMLGLCYRNGYGTQVNLDSARYWLTQAALRNDTRAIEELADASAERSGATNIKETPMEEKQKQVGNRIPSKFKEIPHNAKLSDLSGEYKGMVLTFDWSGKHLLNQNELTLKLINKGTGVSGEWLVNDMPAVPLTGQLTESSLVFDQTNGQLSDHYHKKEPLFVQFRESKLNIEKIRDTVLLTGNVLFYDVKAKEKQRPQFITLIKTTDLKKEDLAITDTTQMNIQNFIAYPNPFQSKLQLKYTLKKSARVSIMLSELQSGRSVYRSEIKERPAGDHTDLITYNGPPGNYVVSLIYGNKLKSSLIFKQ